MLYRLQEKLANLSNIERGWCSLLIPILGLFMAPYFAYYALRDEAPSAKKLIYVNYFLAIGEFIYFGTWLLLDILLLLSVVTLVYGFFYMTKNHLPHSNIKDWISVLNHVLDQIGISHAKLNMDLNHAQIQLSDVDKMTGQQFEIYMVSLLNSVGFKQVTHTKPTGDFGLDAVGYSPDHQTRIGWQFKHYNNADMGYDAVEQTASGSLYYKTQINYTLNSGSQISHAAYKGANRINQNQQYQFITVQGRATLQKLIKMNALGLQFNNKMQVVNKNGKVQKKTLQLVE